MIYATEGVFSPYYAGLNIVMVGVIVTGSFGFVFDRGLRLLERALLPWKRR